MAAFTVAQVPGWQVVVAAARLVDVPLLIGAPDGVGGPLPVAGYRWGDPDALRAAADEWTRAGREAHEWSGPSGDLHTTALAVRGGGWTGIAAQRYLEREQRFEEALGEVGVLTSRVGTWLYGLADEAERTIEQQVATVVWTVAAITAPLATWATNAAAAPVVVNALVSMTGRLEAAAREQYTTALDRRRELMALIEEQAGDGGGGGGGGGRVPGPSPFAAMVADADGGWDDANGWRG